MNHEQRDMKICYLNCPSTVCKHGPTPPETTWWERFHELYYDSKVTTDDFLSKVEDLIRAEKKESYQEGLEKAKEVVGIAYLAARGKEENKVLLKAQEKIQELID